MLMRRALGAGAVLLAAQLAGATALPLLAASPAIAKVLAKVNGHEITDDDVKIAAQDIGPSLPQQLEGPARDSYILDYLIDGELVAQKAKADKTDATPDFAKKLAYYREKLMMETVLTKVAQDATTDDAMKKVYDEAKAAQKPEEEVRARHILVATEADAQAVLKRLRAGEDFAKVAKDMSKDPGSEGGELGWFTKDRMVPDFADAAFKLPLNQLSEPVKSQFGWHVIQVEEKRTKQFPPFDEVKEQIARYVVQKAQSEMIVKLRDTAKIERTDPPVDPAAPGAATAPAPDATPAPTPAAPTSPAPAKK